MSELELEYWRAVLILDLLAAELLTCNRYQNRQESWATLEEAKAEL